MDTDFGEGQVTLTVKEGTYSAGFVERAIAFALANGLTDQRDEKKSGELQISIHTSVGPMMARPMTDNDSYPGFWLDWEVNGEYIALSTSEYHADEGIFVTHEYADFSEDSPTKSTTHYFAEKNITDVDAVLQRLWASS